MSWSPRLPEPDAPIEPDASPDAGVGKLDARERRDLAEVNERRALIGFPPLTARQFTERTIQAEELGTDLSGTTLLGGYTLGGFLLILAIGVSQAIVGWLSSLAVPALLMGIALFGLSRLTPLRRRNPLVGTLYPIGIGVALGAALRLAPT